MRTRREYRQVRKEPYLRWQKEHPNIKLTFLEFQQIIYSFNYAFRDYLLETGEKAKLPWGLGDFSVLKRKPRQHKKSPKTGKMIECLPIDWKTSNKINKIVRHLNRHTDGYRFWIKWYSRTSYIKHVYIWSFKPYRVSSRLVNHYLKKDYKNQFKYQQSV